MPVWAPPPPGGGCSSERPPGEGEAAEGEDAERINTRTDSERSQIGSSCCICLDQFEYGTVIRQSRCGHCFHPTCQRELYLPRERAGIPSGRRLWCPICRMNTLRFATLATFFDHEKIPSDGGPGTPFSIHSVSEADAAEPPAETSESSESSLPHPSEEDLGPGSDEDETFEVRVRYQAGPDQEPTVFAYHVTRRTDIGVVKDFLKEEEGLAFEFAYR